MSNMSRVDKLIKMWYNGSVVNEQQERRENKMNNYKITFYVNNIVKENIVTAETEEEALDMNDYEMGKYYDDIDIISVSVHSAVHTVKGVK